ncbi:replication protein [Vreelandella indica]|uniref:replication protein n=1 Tax=Vreelandella indica TaxID=3126500 RepID=UPI00300DF47D
MSNLAHISDHERYQAQQQAAPESRSIQVEDGYTRTANALVEAFMRAPLTSREARVIRVIERMTYGWNKAEDWIAASVISEMTGMPEGKCSETLNSLIRKKVVTRRGGGRSPVRINKTVSEWDFTAQKARVTPKRKADPEWGESPQNGVSESPQNGVTPKDMKDKPHLTTFDGDSDSAPENPKPAAPKKPAKAKPAALDLTDLPSGVSAEAAKAFIDHRKALKKPLTQRALTLALGEAVKASEAIPGMTPDQAIDEAILAGWQGVKAQWLINRLGGCGASPQRSDGRKGFAQPMPVGSYGANDLELPEWARD